MTSPLTFYDQRDQSVDHGVTKVTSPLTFVEVNGRSTVNGARFKMGNGGGLGLSAVMLGGMQRFNGAALTLLGSYLPYRDGDEYEQIYMMNGGKYSVKATETDMNRLFEIVMHNRPTCAVQRWGRGAQRLVFDVDLDTPEKRGAFDLGAACEHINHVCAEMCLSDREEAPPPTLWVARAYDESISSKVGYHIATPLFMNLGDMRLVAGEVAKRVVGVDTGVYRPGSGIRMLYASKPATQGGDEGVRAYLPYASWNGAVLTMESSRVDWSVEFSIWPMPPHEPYAWGIRGGTSGSETLIPAAQPMPVEEEDEDAAGPAAPARRRGRGVPPAAAKVLVENQFGTTVRKLKWGQDGRIIASVNDLMCRSCHTAHTRNTRSSFVVVGPMSMWWNCLQPDAKPSPAIALDYRSRVAIWGESISQRCAAEVAGLPESETMAGVALWLKMSMPNKFKVTEPKSGVTYMLDTETNIWQEKPAAFMETHVRTRLGMWLHDVVREGRRVCACDTLGGGEGEGESGSMSVSVDGSTASKRRRGRPAAKKQPLDTHTSTECPGHVMIESAQAKLAALERNGVLLKVCTVAFHEPDWNSNDYSWGIPFADGTFINVKDGVLKKERIRADMYVTCYVKRPYNPSAQPSQLFIDTLVTCLPDIHKREYLIDFLAASFCADTGCQEFLMCLGKLAGNGKSLIFDAVAHAMNNLVATLTPQAFLKNTNPSAATPALMGLPGRRLALVSDIARGQIDTGQFKGFVHFDRDPQVRGLYQNFKGFTNRAHIVVLSNSDLEFPLEDEGVSRSMVVVNWVQRFVNPTQFTVEQRMLHPPGTIEHARVYTRDNLPPNVHVMNSGLKEKLMGEADGVVAYILAAMAQYAGRGGMRPKHESIITDSKMSRHGRDPVYQFVNQFIRCTPGVNVEVQEVYTAFSSYCRHEEGLRNPLPKNKFMERAATLCGISPTRVSANSVVYKNRDLDARFKKGGDLYTFTSVGGGRLY